MTAPVPDSADFLTRIGPRADRRAEPRAAIALAGAGCALAVLGALIVSGDNAVSESGGGFNQVPGIVLSATVIVAGFVLVAQFGTGPVATAGTVASVLGVPPLLFFLTFNVDSFPPYSSEAILYLSTAAWLLTWAVGPARGRPFPLGAGLIGLWLAVLHMLEDVFDTPFNVIASLGGPDFGETDPFGAGFSFPDLTTLGVVSLVFGAGYLVTARRLDARGQAGLATPFAVATIPALAASALFLADELDVAGTGLFITAIGAALTFQGAAAGRRFTTWFGGGAAAFGVAIVLGDITDDATIAGVLLIAGGAGLVAAGFAVTTVLDENDEMAPGPSASPRGANPAPPLD